MPKQQHRLPVPVPDAPPIRKSPAKKKADPPANTRTTPAKRAKLIKSEDGDDDSDSDFAFTKKSVPSSKRQVMECEDGDFDDFGDIDESLLQAVDDIEQGLGDDHVANHHQVTPPPPIITSSKANPLPVMVKKAYIPEPPLPKVATTPVAIFQPRATPSTPQTLADLAGKTGTFIMQVMAFIEIVCASAHKNSGSGASGKCHVYKRGALDDGSQTRRRQCFSHSS